jgi:hypothetical protein
MICAFTATVEIYIPPSPSPSPTPTRTPSITPTPSVVYYGYNLSPVAGGTCSPPTGTDVTAYKTLGGSLVEGNILYTDFGSTVLSTGYYSDGTYLYTVNSGTISSKVTCPVISAPTTYYTLT